MPGILGKRQAPASGRRSAVPPGGWPFLTILYATAVWITIVTRVQWGPDTAFQLAWIQRMLGHSEPDSVRRTVDFLAYQDGISCATSTLPWCNADNYAMYFSGDYAATVGSRMMTRLLSAPFVALFGPWSMVVISVIAYGVGIVCVVLLVNRMTGPRWALLAGILMITPWLVSNWAVHANTEALAMAFTAGALLALPLKRVGTARHVVWFSVLLALGLFTRQFAVTIAVGTVLAWLLVVVRDRRVANPWAPFAAAGVATTALTVWIQAQMTSGYAAEFSTFETYQRNTNTSGLADVLLSVPLTAGRIIGGDWRHVRTDLVLSAVLVVTVVSVCWRFRSELSALTLGMATVTLGLNLIVNSDSIFRYHTPSFPVYVVAAIALLADLVRRRSPARSTEAPTTSPTTIPGAEPADWREVPSSWWAALVGAYVFVLLVVRGVDVPDAGLGNGPALHGAPGPDIPGAILPILAYAGTGLAVSWLGSRLWGRWGVLPGLFLLVPSVVVELERGSFLEPLAAFGVAAGLCLLPWADLTLRGRPWWFGTALLGATVVDPYTGVVLGGVALVWLVAAARGDWRNPWGAPLLAGAAGVAAAMVLRALPAVPTPSAAPLVLGYERLGSDLMLVAVILLVLVLGLRAWRRGPAVPLAVGALVTAVGACVFADAGGGRPVTAMMPLLALAATAGLAVPRGTEAPARGQVLAASVSSG